MRDFYKQKVCYSIISTALSNAWMLILNKKALFIQKHWKGYLVRKKFK